MTRSSLIIAVVACLLLGTAGTSLGAGFEVAEQSGRLLGNAYAGKAAEAGDASTVFFNPAGIMKLHDFNAVMSVHVLWASGRFSDDGSTGALGADIGNLNGGNAGDMVWIPNTYVCFPVADNISVGLGINAPFGLTTDYEDGWKGRYHALHSHLETLNINPCVAYRINETFSVGVGVNIQRAEARLTQAIDFGTIAFAQLGPTTATALGFSPQGNDGEGIVTGEGWAYGFNAGVLVELSEKTRIGVSYRSAIEHTLEGDGDFKMDSTSAVLTSSGAFRDVDVEAKAKLPQQASLSAYHELNDQISLLADVTWTGWSSFDELRIEFDNEAQPDSVTPEDWDDVFRFSLGAVYRPDEHLTLRIGGAFDQSPISDKRRTARIPTNDRIWASFGLGYKLSETMDLDITYMHVWIKDGDVEDVASTGQLLKGTFKGDADVLGINLSIRF